jgi:hypothetical protein
MRLTPALAVGALTVGSLLAHVAPASAATTVERTASCATSAASITVTFGVTDDAAAHGTLRAANGSPEGEFSSDPAMTVRVRDGYGRVVVAKRVTDGSLSLAFARQIAGPNWTAEATIDNTAAGPCTTPRVKIAAK